MNKPVNKYIGLVLVALLVFATEAQAQTQPQFGLRIGGALAQLRGSDDTFGNDATDRKFGLTVGAFAEVPLSSRLAVQPELLYTQKGGSADESFSEDGLNGRIESDFNLHYLALPVLVKYNVPVSGRFMPSLYAGPYLAYSLKRDISLDIESDEGDDLDLSFDADDVFKRFDYGATFGADFGYRFARRTATIGLRYDLGLANVFKDDATFGDFGDDIDLSDVEARTHEISVVLGVMLF